MSDRLRNKISSAVNYEPLVVAHKDYGMADLNWKDSGGTFNEPKEVEDPSKNDFIKGYNMDSGRYEFKQWANKSKKNIKQAAQEVLDMSYTPKSLAKTILTLWRNNGPLQDFFDAFTSNQKMKNDMKEKIADILCKNGYDVIPTLHDEKVRHANNQSKIITLAEKYSEEENIEDLMKALTNIFPDSKVIRKVANDIKNLKIKQKINVDKDSMSGLMDYYNKILPIDYSRSLVQRILNKPKRYFDEFKDFELSDVMVNQRQKFNKGEQDFMSRGPKDGGGMGGYNFPADMRGDGPGGVRPTMLETGPRMAKLKKKK